MAKEFLDEVGVDQGIIKPAKQKIAALQEEALAAVGGNNLEYNTETDILTLKKDNEVLSETRIERPQYGIQLGNVTGISATNLDEGAALSWTNPSDIVVDGQVLAKFKATLVLRKAGSAPVNRYDGTIVYDGVNETFNDSGLENDVEYYYAFFPHSTDDVYTYDEAETISFTPSYTRPSLPTDFSVIAGDQFITASWTLPDDAIGVMVDLDPGNYSPIILEKNGSYTKDGLVNGSEYRVRCMSVKYSASGTMRGSEWSAWIRVTPIAARIWGYHHDFTKLNPDEAITYGLDGTINKDYAPMMTNSGNGTVTAGSWQSFLDDILIMKPAAVKKDGTLDYWLDPTDYTKKASGGASDYNNTSYNGGFFVWINKIYMKEVYAADGNSRDVYFADKAIDEGYHAVSFIDSDGKELEGYWLPMAYLGDAHPAIIAGTIQKSKTTEVQQQTIAGFNSTRAKFLGGPALNFFRDLEYMLYKNTDIQKTGGYGLSNKGSVSDNSVVPNGAVVGFYGTGNASDSATRQTANKMFHSQVLGSYNQWIRDPYTIKESNVLKVSPRYKYGLSGDTISDASAYVEAGYEVDASLKTTSCYASHMVKISDEYGALQKHENNASNSTGLCDYLYYGDNPSDVRVARRLGYYHNGLSDGPACVSLYSLGSDTGSHLGAALLLLPSAGYTPAA